MDIRELLAYVKENHDFKLLSPLDQKSFFDIMDTKFKKASNRGLFFREKFLEIVTKYTEIDEEYTISEIYTHLENSIQVLVDVHFWDTTRLRTSLNSYIFGRLFEAASPTLYYLENLNSNFKISLSELIAQYPILWFKIIYTVGCGFDFLQLALFRLKSDSCELNKWLGVTYSDLYRFKVLESDPHNGHQKVICFIFSNRLKLVYKPRALDGEEYFNEILMALSPAITLPILKICNKGDYGYMTWVSSYGNYQGNLAYEIGNLLAIACTIGLTDLHAENIILSKNGLNVIDCEAIGMQSLDFTSLNKLRSPNVLDIGILPSPEGFSMNYWWDISACGFTDRTYTVPTGIRYHRNGGPPKLIRHYLKQKHSKIKSALSKINLEEIISNMTSGFEEACKLLLSISPINIKRNDFRYIYRPTGVYHRTLLRLTDYNCSQTLKNIYKEVEPYFSDLKKIDLGEGSFLPTQIIAEEIVSLIFGDIPRLNREHLKRSIPSTASIDVWSVPDIEINQKLIRNSLKLYRKNNKLPFTYENTFNGPQKTFQENLGAFLNGLITPDLKEMMVFGPKSNTYVNIPKISRMEYSLYDGLTGSYLMLAVCNSLTGNTNNKLLTELENIFANQFISQMKDGKCQSLSEGIIGVMYCYAYLERLGIEPFKYRRYLTKFATLLPQQISSFNNSSTDIVSGISGLMLVLDATQKVIKHPKFDNLKIQIVNEILKRQTESGSWNALGFEGLAGFSHGGAGIRYALGRFTSQNAYRKEAVMQSMRKAELFEDHLFEKTQMNWRDLRHANINKQVSNFSAWCHGAAGIGLSEYHLIQMNLSSRYDRIEAALNLSKIDLGEVPRLCLCCGLGAIYEISKELNNSNFDNNLIDKISLAPKYIHEANSPTSLFRSFYGINFLQLVKQNFSSAPSILMLQ